MAVSKAIDVQGGIVVAHDGSRHADGALRTAVRFAAALNGQVTVARVWSIATAPRPSTWARGYMPPLEDFEAETLAVLERAIAPVRADNPDVTIVAAVAKGNPVEKLIEASSRADLIVVGSRGRGGFTGLLLGSVSAQVVRHSRCAVLVDKFTDEDQITDEDSLADEGELADGAADTRGSTDTPGEDNREQMEQALASELKLD